MNANLHEVARQFIAGHTVIDISPLGNGLINDTFLIATSSRRVVLQRLNVHVFAHPEQVMDNLSQLSLHIGQKSPARVKLQIPAPIPTLDGQAYYLDQQGRFWRALQLIEPAESRERITRDSEAAQVGFALGHFHKLCNDLAPERLHDTLPGFHITPGYFQNYLSILDRPLQVEIDGQCRQCQDFIRRFRDDIVVLEQARQRGELAERVVHGDPKLNNFLFQPGTDSIISLIDLDTVKPGLLHYDIGDCLRSSCRITADNRFDLPRCQIILQSYLYEAGEFFTDADYDYLYAAIWLIPFELGLRFFSDYLNGNRYFKVSRPRQNLERALAQFALCDNIAKQRLIIESTIQTIKKRFRQL